MCRELVASYLRYRLTATDSGDAVVVEHDRAVQAEPGVGLEAARRPGPARRRTSRGCCPAPVPRPGARTRISRRQPVAAGAGGLDQPVGEQAGERPLTLCRRRPRPRRGCAGRPRPGRPGARRAAGRAPAGRCRRRSAAAALSGLRGVRPAASAHRSAIGHRSQRGERAVQTSAPSSMTATLCRAGSAGGTVASASARSSFVGADVVASASPRKTRACTRRTLVSSTAWRCPNPKVATAAAV